MTGLKHVVKRRVHLERSQPSHRWKKGFLEKKKDYVERAKNYHRAQRKIKKLSEAARTGNKDEFNRKMINCELKDGEVVRKKAGKGENPKVLEEMKELPLINLATSVARNALEKKRQELHGLRGETATGSHIMYLSDSEIPSDDGENGLRKLDAAKYFDTPEQLMLDKNSRYTHSKLRSKKVVGAAVFADSSEAYAEAKRRESTLETLTAASQMLETKKNLHESKPYERRKMGESTKGVEVYRWAPQRRR